MITQLYVNIAAGLSEVKSCGIYREEAPQSAVLPYFLITLGEQNPSRGLNGRMKNAVNIDISYFPEAEDGRHEECWRTGQDLTRKFAVKNYKIKKRNLKIVDEVLHFTFVVDYREADADVIPTMQTGTQNTNLKEE